MRLFESQTNDFDWWIVIRGKRTCPLTRCGHFLECPLIRDFTAFVSFPLSRVWPAISAVFLEDFFTCLFCYQNSFVFLIWWIMSDMELEKSRPILHIREQSCSLATRLHTQFHYIYKIPNTCLLLPKHSETRSRKSWELATPSS